MYQLPICRLVSAITLLILPFCAIAAIAQTAPRMSAYQYNQIFGWRGGDHRKVDTIAELNPQAYAAFWNMSAEDRQIAFNFFDWPVIEQLITLELEEIHATPDSRKRRAQPRIRAQYEDLINLLSQRFSLPIKSADLYNGLMYFVDLGEMAGNLHFLTITSLIDNIDLLKPSSNFDLERPELKQRVIRVSPNGNVFFNDLNINPELSKKQKLLRDFLFR